MGLRRSGKKLLRRLGYDLVKLPEDPLGADPFRDMQRFLKGVSAPVIFDVGGNVGQTVKKFRNAFPDSTIHSFEPSPTTYEKLKAACQDLPGVSTWNVGVGSSVGTLPFQENDYPDMSSFLAPSTLSWGSIVKTTEVPVVTLDAFADEHGIPFVHLLKSDTQGYDFEVFKGASRLMSENRIALVYFEIIFSDMYKELPLFHDVFRYLWERNFVLVTFYKANFQKELVSWTDALFINRDYYSKRSAKRSEAANP